MTHKTEGHLEVEDRGDVLIVRVNGGPHSLFGLDIATQLEELVDRVDRDPGIRAVVFTGTRPGRSSAMRMCGGCRKRGRRSRRWAVAVPPRSRGSPEALLAHAP
ncbi:enoyl-CoA hydratase/isomerase domain protein [Rhodococcus sp. JVH1]|uniref:enoyl-CoA hydratase/isomerase domain protein n=1 Tax=Rhodococcus sp. JVH1 TaxID=745408 RepID=UPI000272214D|nr:enoyl-CoA hydratase/isomerase domain protein [Rhodococcus sp. JVH1]EJJ01223.1 enoyl-CoA hydratase/isomerase domain protein [Rhodococcus sp. JVH1]